jgi:hypothetical protein
MAFWRLDLSCTEANEPDPAGQRGAVVRKTALRRYGRFLGLVECDGLGRPAAARAALNRVRIANNITSRGVMPVVSTTSNKRPAKLPRRADAQPESNTLTLTRFPHTAR